METVDHGESKPLSTELLFEEMGQYCQKSGVSNRRLEDSDDVVSDDTFSDMPPTNMEFDHGAKELSDMPPAKEQNSIDPDLEAESDGEDSTVDLDGVFAITYPIICSGWTSYDVSYNHWSVYSISRIPFSFKEVKEEEKRLVWVLKLETQAGEEYKVKYGDYKERATCVLTLFGW